ncbi:reverse transcriptase [Gossypium australe]|uniref:Reverse transcriptase n=1 Tax=Gossypium australe TaxID=47621 RepID=A0A5B6W6P0_9ROSI|nr:reverse transcriptase [Gossypium australe]
MTLVLNEASIARRDNKKRKILPTRTKYYAHIICERLHLFGDATEKGVQNLKTILRDSNVSEQRREQIANLLGVRTSRDPKKYLGLANIVGRDKKMFQILEDKMIGKIRGWSARFLSRGKELFIKAVLQAIPTYAMACFLLPKSFCTELENYMGRL